jgi:hypothetical protein
MKRKVFNSKIEFLCNSILFVILLISTPYIYGETNSDTIESEVTDDASSQLYVLDLKISDSFLAKLKYGGDPLSQYLREQFSFDTMQLLEKYDGSALLTEALKNALIHEFDRLLHYYDLYDEQVFAGVELSDEILRLIEQNPEDKGLVHLNRFLLEQACSGDLNIILHEASSSPVHQWIAYQAKFIWSKDEIKRYLPSSWSPSIYSLDNKKITLGARLEDDEQSTEFKDCYQNHPFCNHFWNPRNGTEEGLKFFSLYQFPSESYKVVQWQSAYRRAQTLWNSALNYYKGKNYDKAYEWLGRVVHLLTDMSVPAHVNKTSSQYGYFDVHYEIPGWDGWGDPDSYENYMKTNYSNWYAENRNYSAYSFGNLLDLFSSMALMAHRFDSNDASGEVDQGKRRSGGFSINELREIGNSLMPEAMKHVASLYWLFWNQTEIYRAKTLTSVTVSGPPWVNENSYGDFTATARFSDGSTPNVTTSASWSVNSKYAAMDSSVKGRLRTYSVSSNQSVTVTASYTYNGVTKSGSIQVTIKDVPRTLMSVTVDGSPSVNESSYGDYKATAKFSDSSTPNVTTSASWSVNSKYAAMDSSVKGRLRTYSVSSNQSVTVTAKYTYNGVTKSGSIQVTIKNR